MGCVIIVYQTTKYKLRQKKGKGKIKKKIEEYLDEKNIWYTIKFKVFHICTLLKLYN